MRWCTSGMHFSVLHRTKIIFNFQAVSSTQKFGLFLKTKLQVNFYRGENIFLNFLRIIEFPLKMNKLKIKSFNLINYQNLLKVIIWLFSDFLDSIG